MSSRHLLPCIAWALVLQTAAAAAQEWTRFRGPNGQGQSEATTIPITWTDNDYNWKAKLPGIGNSSPVVWGDKVFTMNADPQTGEQYVLCFSAATGDKLWQRNFPSTVSKLHPQNTYSSSTPAVDAERVYVAWATETQFTLMALDHAGNDVWARQLGPYISQHGFGTSPIVVDDMLIITNDQEGDDRFILAVDRRTGDDRWRISRKYANNRQNASYSTPCIMETPQGRELILCSWAHGISSHDLQTGAVNWELPVFKLRPVASPVLVGGLILATCGEGSGNNTLVALRPGDKSGRQPEVVYTIDKTSAPYVPTLCTAGNLAFLWGEKGIAACIDAPTGTLHWRERVGGNYYCSPVRVGDRIYCVSLDGEVVVLAASPTFKVLGRTPLGETSRSTPAVADGRMYLRTQSQLFSIGGK